MMIRYARLLPLALLLLVPSALAQGRFEEFTRKFKQTKDQVSVVGAGYLGGGGTEWLASGGIQPEGTIVVVGVTLGPTFEIGAHKVTVLGKDGKAPAAPEQPLKLDKNNKPIKDKKTGKTIPEPFLWNHPSATAFVVRLSSDLKTIKSVARLPWKAGGATACVVDNKGNIYVAGPAGENLPSVSGERKTLLQKDTAMKSGGCKQIYLAKLSSDASKVMWLRTLAGTSDAPRLNMNSSGKIQLQSADLRTFDTDGKQTAVFVFPGGLTTRQGATNVRTTAINPKDGTIVRAGEHHWHTKREPYRDPILNIHKPDGKLLYELYNWDGPFVGLDNLRLVSDSAVRRVAFDEDGNLVIYAWSDGGNSVMYREPNDIRKTSDKLKGLGMSAWGAGVLSCAYIIKIETKNYKVVGGALWLAYTNRNKPNSVWINTLGFAGDGSVCFGGTSAWGLIETGNKLNNGQPTGPYITVLNKDCSSVRFSSVLPGAGITDVADGNRWGIIRGKIKGKPVVLFVGGAGEGAVTSKGPQAKYGGGLSDGYMVLLDLSSK